HPATLRGPGRPRRLADRLLLECAAYQRKKTLDGVGTVFLPATMGLRLDDDDAFAGATSVVQGLDPRLALVRQCRAVDVEPQMTRARHLVDVLSAGALCPDHGQFDVALIDENGVLYVQHRER